MSLAVRGRGILCHYDKALSCFSNEEKIEIYNTISAATDVHISGCTYVYTSHFRISLDKKLQITKHH